VRSHLDSVGASYTYFEDDDELCDKIAQLIDDGKVVGLLQGRMEFGPRALGARSIVGDPRNPKMQATMNLKIKFRESFRPFAPSCLQERARDYFDLNTESPYMLLVAPVKLERRVPVSVEQEASFGIQKLNIPRSDIPAITHVDYSARVQTVDANRHPRYYKLLKAFEKLTGCGVLINTSFNIRGEPIVCRPEEAYRCFMLTNMDVLVMESFVCMKEEQPEMAGSEEYRSQFDLD
jgi:carbamoyltransferase